MAAPIIRGDDTPQLQRQSLDFDWRNGATYVEDWKGTSQSKMVAKWNGLVYGVTKSKMSLSNSMAEATFEWASINNSTPTNSKELTIDRWEIPEPRTEKPLVSHPKMYDIFMKIGDSDGGWGATDQAVSNYAARFQKGVSENQPPSTIGSNSADPDFILGWLVDDNFPGISNLSGADGFDFLVRQYLKALNGQTTYQDSTYSLRHTTNTPSYWSANVSDVNTNCIYSLTQLQDEVTNIGFWQLPLPGRLNYKIAAAHNDFVNSLPTSALNRTSYMVGWLKSPFGESSVGRSRIEIQGAYVLDQWPLDIYPAASFT